MASLDVNSPFTRMTRLLSRYAKLCRECEGRADDELLDANTKLLCDLAAHLLLMYRNAHPLRSERAACTLVSCFIFLQTRHEWNTGLLENEPTKWHVPETELFEVLAVTRRSLIEYFRGRGAANAANAASATAGANSAADVAAMAAAAGGKVAAAAASGASVAAAAATESAAPPTTTGAAGVAAGASVGCGQKALDRLMESAVQVSSNTRPLDCMTAHKGIGGGGGTTDRGRGAAVATSGGPAVATKPMSEPNTENRWAFIRGERSVGRFSIHSTRGAGAGAGVAAAAAAVATTAAAAEAAAAAAESAIAAANTAAAEGGADAATAAAAAVAATAAAADARAATDAAATAAAARDAEEESVPAIEASDLGVEVDTQVMQLTLKSSHPQSLPSAVAKSNDVITVFGRVAMQACIVAKSQLRVVYRLVGRSHDVHYWSGGDAKLPPLEHQRPYFPDELFPSEKAWLPSVLEPVRRAYLLFPQPLELYLPEAPLPDDAQVAYLVGKQPDQPGAWRDVYVYRARRMVHIYRIESHGRRHYRTLEYTSDARFCLRAMQPSLSHRNQAWPRWERHGAGHPYANSCPGEQSAVITRAWSVRANVSLGEETYVPARLLWGVLPETLLEDFIFWQDEDDQLRGYPVALNKDADAEGEDDATGGNRGATAGGSGGGADHSPHSGEHGAASAAAGETSKEATSATRRGGSYIYVTLRPGHHVAFMGEKHRDKAWDPDSMSPPVIAAVFSLQLTKAVARRDQVLNVLHHLRELVTHEKQIGGAFPTSFEMNKRLLALVELCARRQLPPQAAAEKEAERSEEVDEDVRELATAETAAAVLAAAAMSGSRSDEPQVTAEHAAAGARVATARARCAITRAFAMTASLLAKRKRRHRTASVIVPMILDNVFEMIRSSPGPAPGSTSSAGATTTTTFPSKATEPAHPSGSGGGDRPRPSRQTSSASLEYEELVLLDLLHAPPDSYLASLADVMTRIENLSHILAWAPLDRAVGHSERLAARHKQQAVAKAQDADGKAGDGKVIKDKANDCDEAAPVISGEDPSVAAAGVAAADAAAAAAIPPLSGAELACSTAGAAVDAIAVSAARIFDPANVSQGDLWLVSLPRLKLTFVTREVDVDEKTNAATDSKEKSAGSLSSNSTVRLYSLDHADLFVTNERVASTARLLDGIPHSLLLSNANSEMQLLVPSLPPARPKISTQPFSTELVLNRADADWAAALENAYYVYPVHVSLSFLFSTTLASALYLLLLRFLHRDYVGTFELCDTVSCDTNLTLEEAQIVAWLGSSINSIDKHPDAHACRLKISLVMLDAPVTLPWDLTSELAGYIAKLGHVSANCRLAHDDELALLTQHAVCDVADKRYNPGSGHTEYRVLLCKNRRAWLRAAARGEPACRVVTPRAASLSRWIDEWDDTLLRYAPTGSSHDAAELQRYLEGLKMKFTPSRLWQLDSVLALISKLNETTERSDRLTIANGGFLMMYQLFQGSCVCRVVRNDCGPSLATLLLPLLPDVRSKTLLSSLLLTMARKPSLARFLPEFADNRKYKRRETYSGVPLPDEPEAPLGVLITQLVTELGALARPRGDPVREAVAERVLSRRVESETRKHVFSFGRVSFAGGGGAEGGGINAWASGGGGGGGIGPIGGGGGASYAQLEEQQVQTEQQCARELADATDWSDLQMLQRRKRRKETVEINLQLKAAGQSPTVVDGGTGKSPVAAAGDETTVAFAAGSGSVAATAKAKALDAAAARAADVAASSRTAAGEWCDVDPKNVAGGAWKLPIVSDFACGKRTLCPVSDTASAGMGAAELAAGGDGNGEECPVSFLPWSECTVVLLPCGHLLSLQVVARVTNCPLCRTTFPASFMEDVRAAAEADAAGDEIDGGGEDGGGGGGTLGMTQPATAHFARTPLEASGGSGTSGLSRFVTWLTKDELTLPPAPDALQFDVTAHPDASSRVAKDMVARLKIDVAEFAARKNSPDAVHVRCAFLPADAAGVTARFVNAPAVEGLAALEAARSELAALIDALHTRRACDRAYVMRALPTIRRLANFVPLRDPPHAERAARARAAEASARRAKRREAALASGGDGLAEDDESDEDEEVAAEHAVPEERERARLLFALRQYAEQEATLTLDFLFCLLISSKSADDLRALNPYVTPAARSAIFDLIVAAVLHTSRVGQVNRAMVEAHDLRVLLSRPTAELDTAAIALKAETLAQQLTVRRHYVSEDTPVPDTTTVVTAHDTSFSYDPRFLLFEYSWNLILRKAQVDLVHEIVGCVRRGRPIVKQMLMGGGKTTVVGPLLTLLLGDGEKLVVQTMPPALLEQSKFTLRGTFSSVIRKRVFTLAFDRSSEMTWSTVSKIRAAARNRGVLLCSATTIKSIQLKLLEKLDVLRDERRKHHPSMERDVRTLAETLKMFASGVLIMDEVDLLLHPLKSELNFPIGAKFPLDFSPERWTIAVHALDAVFFVERRRMSVGFTQSSRARALLASLERVISEGYSTRALQRSPHLVLLNLEWCVW